MSIASIAPTTPAWRQYLAANNPLSLSDADLSSLLVALMDCMRPYTDGKAGGGIYSAARSFFSNTYNMPGIREAIQRYGLEPCQNTAGSIYTFYKASVYFNQFPLPPADPANCTIIQTMVNSVTAEVTNVQKSYTNGLISSDSEGYTMIPLNDRLADLNSLYAQLNCDVSIQSQTAQSDIATLSQAAGGTAGAAPPYLLYGIYAAAGLIGIVAIVMVLKPSKKAK